MSPTPGHQAAGSGARPHTGTKLPIRSADKGSRGAPYQTAPTGKVVRGRPGGFPAGSSGGSLPSLPEEGEAKDYPFFA